MNNHFTPDKYKRIEQEQNKKTPSRFTNNQPEPDIFCVMNFNPKPTDYVWVYQVNPKRKMSFTELDQVAKKLGALYGADVFVSEYLFNNFHVYLTDKATWWDVRRHTLKVLGEFDS